jgi:hypothetical protein
VSSLFKILGIVGLLATALWLESPSDDLRPQTHHFENPAPQAILAKEYHFKLSANEDPFPTISGTTDLPEGTKLFVNLLKPHLPNGQQRMAQGLPACEEDCFPASSGVLPYRDPIVQNGRFSAGPFHFGDKPVKPNIYPIRISIVPDPVTGDNVDVINHPVYVSEVRIPTLAAQVVGDPPAVKQTLQQTSDAANVKSRSESWQRIKIPISNEDGTAYAYDTNSILAVKNDSGQIIAAEVTVRIVGESPSIHGRLLRLTFNCTGSETYQINHSVPLPTSPFSQEGSMANIVCSAVHL